METEKFAKPNGVEVHPEPVTLELAAPFETRIRRSERIGKLIFALAKAQLEFGAVTKDASNPGYMRGGKASKYATLDAVIDATRVPLAKNELVIIAIPHELTGGRNLSITSVLAHSSDEYIESTITMPAVDKVTPQELGKLITYARRYQWSALTGVAPEEDDDGNHASGVGSKEAAQDVARKGLEEKLQSPDPKVRAMAQDGLNAIRAKEQGKSGDLTAVLQESLKNNGVTKAHIPLDDSLEAAKDDGLFDEVRGTIQQVRIMATSAAKGSKPYRKIAIACMKEGGEIVDLEISAFDNFKMSDGTCFGALDHPDTVEGAARLIVERSGKYLNLKDIKQLGKREWDARVGVVRRD